MQYTQRHQSDNDDDNDENDVAIDNNEDDRVRQRSFQRKSVPNSYDAQRAGLKQT